MNQIQIFVGGLIVLVWLTGMVLQWQLVREIRQLQSLHPGKEIVPRDMLSNSPSSTISFFKFLFGKGYMQFKSPSLNFKCRWYKVAIIALAVLLVTMFVLMLVPILQR